METNQKKKTSEHLPIENSQPIKLPSFAVSNQLSHTFLENYNSFKVSSLNRDTYEKLINKVAVLQEKVKLLQKRIEKSPREKKKNRRKASQIERRYQCYVKDCGKIYGSHTSLKNHLKLKHLLKVHNLKRKKRQASSSNSQNSSEIQSENSSGNQCELSQSLGGSQVHQT